MMDFSTLSKPLRIVPLGAIEEVTGSAYLVNYDSYFLLIDFGMFQGGARQDVKNRVPSTINVSKLNAVLITHCHLDHVGRLPLLVKKGYKGPIYLTKASLELTRLILHDAARLQETDIVRINRKRLRQGKEPLEPLFTTQDVDALEQLYYPVNYGESFEAAPGIYAKFVDAGHILGSAVIQLIIDRPIQKVSIVFSGDLGQLNSPILQDFERLDKADVVIMESTYGNHNHRPIGETVEEFEQIVNKAVEENGKILVPTFAVGRAQVLLYYLAEMFRKNHVPQFPVFLDSPMAIEATKIYERYPELLDTEARERIKEHYFLREFSSLRLCQSVEESMEINSIAGPCLIMAGSGMCTGGRILHHLKHNLWRPETWVIFVGYQSHGTLGRMLIDGIKKVKILGEQVVVKAKIKTLGGFSAHAGQNDLLSWLEGFIQSRPRIILTHGEKVPREVLAQKIEERFGIHAELPKLGDTIEIV